MFAIIFLFYSKPLEMGIILFFISAVLSIFAFSTFYNYRKNSYKVKIDKYKIWIGNRIFFHNEIKEIVLTGKKTWVPPLQRVPFYCLIME